MGRKTIFVERKGKLGWGGGGEDTIPGNNNGQEKPEGEENGGNIPVFPRFIFYEFECRQDEKNADENVKGYFSKHVPNLCVASSVCQFCYGQTEEDCKICGVREHVFKVMNLGNGSLGEKQRGHRDCAQHALFRRAIH